VKKDLERIFKWFVVPFIFLAAGDIYYQVLTNNCQPKIPFCTDQ